MLSSRCLYVYNSKYSMTASRKEMEDDVFLSFLNFFHKAVLHCAIFQEYISVLPSLTAPITLLRSSKSFISIILMSPRMGSQ